MKMNSYGLKELKQKRRDHTSYQARHDPAGPECVYKV